MENADFLPTDLAECQQLLLAAWQQSVHLKKRVAASEAQMTAAEQKAAATEQQIAELNRVWTPHRIRIRNCASNTSRHWKNWRGTSDGFMAAAVSESVKRTGSNICLI